jgi:hypothetical protein
VYLESGLLDGVPLVLAVIIAAVDEARHGVPAHADFALHLLGVLFDQDVEQAHLLTASIVC